MVEDTSPTFGSLIRNPGFRYLWINQILVQLAYNTLNFTLLIWVFKLTESNLAVSALLLAMYVPAVFFGVFAGVFVDIADRRKIIRIIDGLLALSFVAFIFIKYSYPLILINMFFINSLAQFFVPAEGSSIPMVVERKQLLLANSLFSLTLYGSFMVGFSLAGPVLGILGLNYAFGIAAAALVVAYIITHWLPPIKSSEISEKYDNFLSPKNLRNMIDITISETKGTIHFIRSTMTVSSSILLLAFIQGVIGILAVVMSSYMENVLHIHATDASYFLMVPLGVGMIAGAYSIGRWGQNIPRRFIVIPAIIAAGLLFILAGFINDIAWFFQSSELPAKLIHPRYFFRAPWLSIFFAFGSFLLGLCAVGIIIPSQTVLQENTNEQMRGKIFAVLAVLMNVLSIVPVILAGALSDLFGPAPIFIFVGALVFATGLVALRPGKFLPEDRISLATRQFLGMGHWQK